MPILRAIFPFFYILLIFVNTSVLAHDDAEGIHVVTAPEVRKIIAENEAPVVNVLSRIEFQMQHIPGTVNIPVDEISRSDLMPENKNDPIVFYCNGHACPYSHRASVLAQELGYKNIHWFRGGILEWRKFQYEMDVSNELISIKVKKISPDKYMSLSKDNLFVLDVRPKWWRESSEKAGVIEGTDIIISLIDLDKSMHLLPRDKPIFIADRLMRQSVHAAKFLTKNGFNVVGILKGGSKRWVAEGNRVLEQSEEPYKEESI